jgi:hypothetical protein
MKLNGTHQLLAYADVNLLGDNTDTIKKYTVIIQISDLPNPANGYGFLLEVLKEKAMMIRIRTLNFYGSLNSEFVN